MINYRVLEMALSEKKSFLLRRDLTPCQKQVLKKRIEHGSKVHAVKPPPVGTSPSAGLQIPQGLAMWALQCTIDMQTKYSGTNIGTTSKFQAVVSEVALAVSLKRLWATTILVTSSWNIYTKSFEGSLNMAQQLARHCWGPCKIAFLAFRVFTVAIFYIIFHFPILPKMKLENELKMAQKIGYCEHPLVTLSTSLFHVKKLGIMLQEWQQTMGWQILMSICK